MAGRGFGRTTLSRLLQNLGGVVNRDHREQFALISGFLSESLGFPVGVFAAIELGTEARMEAPSQVTQVNRHQVYTHFADDRASAAGR